MSLLPGRKMHMSREYCYAFLLLKRVFFSCKISAILETKSTYSTIVMASGTGINISIWLFFVSIVVFPATRDKAFILSNLQQTTYDIIISPYFCRKLHFGGIVY